MRIDDELFQRSLLEAVENVRVAAASRSIDTILHWLSRVDDDDGDDDDYDDDNDDDDDDNDDDDDDDDVTKKYENGVYVAAVGQDDWSAIGP